MHVYMTRLVRACRPSVAHRLSLVRTCLLTRMCDNSGEGRSMIDMLGEGLVGKKFNFMQNLNSLTFSLSLN